VIVKVLGTGCANCRALETTVREVVGEMGLDCQVEKVEDMAEIMRYGVMATPALVVEDRVVASGHVPSRAEVTSMLADAALAGSVDQS